MRMTMNKTFRCILLLAVAVSCQIAEEAGPQAEEQASAPLFHATLEGAVSPTKVYTDEALHVLWNQDDYITIFAQTTRNKKYHFKGADGATGGDFEYCPEGFGSGNSLDFNFAVYPYDASTSYSYGEDAVDPADDCLLAVFPKNQAYRADSFGPGANLMVAKSSTDDLPFKNVGSYLCLKLYGEGFSVRSIILQGNGGESLSGPVKISFGDGGLPSLSFDTSDPALLHQEIVLTPATPVALGENEAAAVTFWMVVPPVTLPGGFTVTVVDSNGGLHQKSTAKPFTFTRNHQMPMKAFALTDDILPAPSLGIHPLSGESYVYSRGTDQVNIYESEGQAWARFLLTTPTSLVMHEMGPFPSDIAAGDRATIHYSVYENGVRTSVLEDCHVTVQSLAGGKMTLVSDEGMRFVFYY